MKLDFTKLSQPTSQTWGQPGTEGTPAFTGVLSRSTSGDTVGTPGDTGQGCPPLSPACPQNPKASRPPIHGVSPLSPRVPTAISLDELDSDEREDFEERAAIMEFDGGLTAVEAERLALKAQAARTLNRD